MNNKNKNYRTDLAYDEVMHLDLESKNYFDTNHERIKDIDVYSLCVDDSNEHYLNKKKGIYYTIDINNINYHDYKKSEEIEEVIARVLKKILIEKNLINKKSLVIGLGNINVTPDAIGPFVLDNVIVTRHLFEDKTISDNYSEVSGISPGVMGNTGIETFDIVKSVIDKIDVDFVIVVDALASSSIMRVNKTIQITDSGIAPGSGVGNKRKEISFETVNKPVIAIGVPTVVDFSTITAEVIELVSNYLNIIESKEKNENQKAQEKTNYFGKVGLLSEQEKKALIDEAITTNGYNMIVTPKDVDIEIEDLSKIVAMAINKALHNRF